MGFFCFREYKGECLCFPDCSGYPGVWVAGTTLSGELVGVCEMGDGARVRMG